MWGKATSSKCFTNHSKVIFFFFFFLWLTPWLTLGVHIIDMQKNWHTWESRQVINTWSKLCHDCLTQIWLISEKSRMPFKSSLYWGINTVYQGNHTGIKMWDGSEGKAVFLTESNRSMGVVLATQPCFSQLQINQGSSTLKGNDYHYARPTCKVV